METKSDAPIDGNSTTSANTDMSDELKIKEIESILRRNIKSKCLIEEAYNYMALIIVEDCPKNAKELIVLIGDFLSDGMTYDEEEALKLCVIIQKQIIEKNLIVIEQRDTIIAEKLSRPVTIDEIAQVGHDGIIREDDFYDPLLAGEKAKGGGNFNESLDRKKWLEKKSKLEQQKAAKEQDALDKKIDEFMATKKKVPPPEVIHDKSGSSKADIYLPSVTLIAGGKALLDKAVVRLARGRKYGLVGRNGIGKTTLINAMCRKELDKLQKNLHILQVEQEIVGDDKTVLDHVIECDVERLALYKEQNDLTNADTSEMEPEEK